jgi:multidrug efflux pump subunit AcrB
VPLPAIGRFELVPGDPPISRRNGERVNTVQAYITTGVLLSTVVSFYFTPPVFSLLMAPSGPRRSNFAILG